MQLAEGFGNYMYILFAVVYVVYSIIKAGKKVNKNRPATSGKPIDTKPASNPSDEISDILGEILEGKHKPSARKEQVAKPIKKKSTLSPFLSSDIEASYFDKSKSPTGKKSAGNKKGDNPKMLLEVEEVDEEAGVDFDIKQAVIYSEILKRPQY